MNRASVKYAKENSRCLSPAVFEMLHDDLLGADFLNHSVGLLNVPGLRIDSVHLLSDMMDFILDPDEFPVHFMKNLRLLLFALVFKILNFIIEVLGTGKKTGLKVEYQGLLVSVLLRKRVKTVWMHGHSPNEV